MPNRPFGVLVIGALAIAIAVVRLIVGFQLMFGGIFGAVPTGSGVFWAGLMALVVGVIYLGVGWAMWSLRPWALVFTTIMAVFGLVDAMFVMIATNSVAYGIAAAAIPAVLLWYVSRDDVRSAFAESDTEIAAENPQATSSRDSGGPPTSV